MRIDAVFRSPTTDPTMDPSADPTVEPTVPTSHPSADPTEQPTAEPTAPKWIEDSVKMPRNDDFMAAGHFNGSIYILYALLALSLLSPR